MKKGFSLIEIIVVIALFSIIGVIVSQSTITTFRGAKRSDSDARVRENIDYAVSVMERHLRNALTVTCTSATRVDFTDQERNAGAFLLNGSGADAHIASYSALPAPTTQRLTNQNLTVSSLGFVCPTPTGNVAPVVNISVTAVDRYAQGTERAGITTSTKVIVRTNY